ncbi:MAG: extracellular solute-binding protein [Ruminococcus sp.]|nr:extracellular solute-binding protein [Ruminococcus sp.]
MKKTNILYVITALSVFLCSCNKEKEIIKNENEYIYEKNVINCLQVNEFTSDVVISNEKVYTVNYESSTMDYVIGYMENGVFTSFSFDTADKPMTNVYFSQNNIFVISHDGHKNTVFMLDKSGNTISSADYSNTDSVYSIDCDSDGNIYVLYISSSSFKSFVDIYDDLGNKKDKVCLNEKLDSESETVMFTRMAVDKENNIYTTVSALDMSDGTLKDHKLYKFSSAFEKISETDLTELGTDITNMFVSSSGELVISGIDGGYCYVNVVNIKTGEVVARYEAEGTDKVFEGENGSLIYQVDKDIFEITDENSNQKISESDSQIIRTYGGEKLVMCTSELSGKPVISVNDSSGNQLETITANIGQNDIINDIYVDSDKLYLLLSDINDGKRSIYIYDDGKETIKEMNTDDNEEHHHCIYSNLCVDNDGNIYFTDENVLMQCDAEAMEISEVSDSTVQIMDICKKSDGEIVVLGNNSEKLSVYSVDSEKLGLETLSDTELKADMHSCIYKGSEKYDFIIENDGLLYGFDRKSQKTECILALNEAGVYSGISQLQFISEEQMFCIDESKNLFSISRVKNTGEKQIIDIACFGLNKTVSEYINSHFSGSKYKIEIKDYNKSGNGGIEQFNLDIVSGDTPDIIISRSNIDIAQYQKNGLLADLSSYIENDGTINRDDYMKCAFGMNNDGEEVYTINPEFVLKTIVAKKSDVTDDPWTYDDLFNYKTDADNIFFMTSYNELIQYFMAVSDSEFVDIDTGKVDFDNDRFKSILEFCKENGINQSDISDPSDNMEFRNGSCSLSIENIIGFRYYNIFEKAIVGEDIALRGISADGANDFSIGYVNTFSVFKDSENKDIAWEIIREFLLDEYQDSHALTELSTGFPVKKSSVDKAVDFAQDTSDEMLQQWIINDELINIGTISDETVENLLSKIESATLEYKVDATVLSIIQSESVAFFEGDTDVDKTAEAIQNKVNLYINEKK